MDRTHRLHALDAVRGFALIAGVVLHATMSFLPGFAATGWPIADRSPSVALGLTFFVIHMFRMTTFFVIAGFFARLVLNRYGVRGFIRNRSIRILIPLLAGWGVLFPIIAATFMWAASSAERPQTSPPVPQVSTAFAFPLTHLWFLYVLLLLYVAMLIVRAGVEKVDREGTLRARLGSAAGAIIVQAWSPLILALPLGAALYGSPTWAPWFGIPTPDQSLIPNLPATIAFSTAFAVGWFVHRQTDLLKAFERHWKQHLVIALVLTGTCIRIAGVAPSYRPGLADPSRLLFYTACYTTAIWFWTFAIIGAALRMFTAPNRAVRYVADASYWIYLVHLPLVFFLQTAMRDWPWPWAVKFPLLMIAALAILFASYHLLVRNTVIGVVLNGRRQRDVPAQPAPSPDGPLAELTGAHKRFGKVLALDGLSLSVQRGELLALLGPNGAGKTTAISLLLGLQAPDAGTAVLFGMSPEQIEARYQVGVMMQEVTLAPDLRVGELIDCTRSYYPAPFTKDEVLALTRTTELANRQYGKLSGGQKRQAQFALAVCGRPSLIFLDEPTAGLDVQAREALWATLRQLIAQGTAIVLTTHYLEEAEALADRVAVLARGRLIANGTVNDIRALVSRKRISCSTSLSADLVGTWPGVVRAERDRDRLNIVATDSDRVVRNLLAEDPELRDLEVLRAGLAEAFSELTQEAA
jgi:ABC-type multidrug transport system ATPase subunit/peptidoglycan/LPS O-acetylase OafA/YrhL